MKSFIMIVSTMIVFTSSVSADTIKLVADEWCPFNCEPETEHPGFVIEIAQSIFAKHGHQVTYTVRPWARAIKEVRSGKYHGAIGAVPQEAEDFIFPKAGQGQAMAVFMKKTGDPWVYQGIDSLNDVRIGFIDDYDYNQEINQYFEENKQDRKRVQVLTGENILSQAVKMLLKERLTAFAEDRSVIRYYLKTNGYVGQMEEAGVIANSKGVTAEEIFIGLSPAKNLKAKSEVYAKMLTEGMGQLRKSGELDKILSKYGITDWKK